MKYIGEIENFIVYSSNNVILERVKNKTDMLWITKIGKITPENAIREMNIEHTIFIKDIITKEILYVIR